VTKADGKEANVPIHPSNVMLVKLELDDDRKKLLEKKAVAIEESD
jgi:ribosomal protein uL24